MWYGCYNLVCEPSFVWYGCYNLVKWWFCANMCGMAVTIWSTCGFKRKYVVWLLQFGRILSLTMCGIVTIWSTCGFELKWVVWLFQLGQLVVLSVNMCGMAVTIWSTCGFERKYVWYGCYNLVNLWFCAQVCVVWLLQFGRLVI